MRLPSPDTLLVEATDRLLAVPQRRGIPLPHLLIPVPFAEPLGLLVTSVSMGFILPSVADAEGGRMVMLLGGMFGAIAIIDAFSASIRARRRLRDARDWSPVLAARYRSEALSCREMLAMPRFIGLLVSAMLCVAAARAFAYVPGNALSTPFAFAVAGLAASWSGRNASAYADCAMPHDPDLRQRARTATSPA